jgi:hypothetical protein
MRRVGTVPSREESALSHPGRVSRLTHAQRKGVPVRYLCVQGRDGYGKVLTWCRYL